MTAPMTRHREVLKTIETFANGICTTDVISLLPDMPRRAVCNSIQALLDWGCIADDPQKLTQREGRFLRFVKPLEQRSQPVRKLKEPTASGWEAQRKDLLGRINALEAWKADAIARFPDLAIEPAVMQARKFVAETLT